jgi:hypothetical protein
LKKGNLKNFHPSKMEVKEQTSKPIGSDLLGPDQGGRHHVLD